MIKDKPMKKVQLSLDPDDYYRLQAIVPKNDVSRVVRLLIARYLCEADRKFYEKLGRQHFLDSLPEISDEAIKALLEKAA